MPTSRVHHARRHPTSHRDQRGDDWATFERELAKLCGTDVQPVDPHDPGFRCSTLDCNPVDVTTAAVAALVSHVRRVVVGADGVVIDLGRRQRLFSGSAALAARLSGRECLWPGCHVPVSHCQIDHLQPWQAGGPTDTTNSGLLCGRHNRLKHTGGYTTWRDSDGRWHTRRPDGTHLPDTQTSPCEPRGSPLTGMLAAG